MPKIIQNLEIRLIEEARKQIEASGYGNVTIRSVAAACGVGVGTVYNYFPSKDALLAAYMLPDWKECMTVICAVGSHSEKPEDVTRCIYDQLSGFTDRHQGVFRDAAAVAGFAAADTQYHKLLRSQLAQPLERFCGSGFAVEFIAEALLTWTVAGKAFEEIYGMIGPLFCHAAGEPV